VTERREPIWMSKQMTREEAIAFGKGTTWESMTDRQIVELQLFTQLSCVPFGRFHEALEKTLGRSVWTHELGSSNMRNVQDEFLGDRPAPTMEQIIGLLPQEKVIVVSP
jgi:hypothetical protein